MSRSQGGSSPEELGWVVDEVAGVDPLLQGAFSLA